MPIYEFICEQCGCEFEELVRSASSTAGLLCPECHSQQVTKKISTFAAKIAGGKATSYWGGSPSSSCNTGST
jgi:putative FmdB family regulatory protein